jgi:TolB protein
MRREQGIEALGHQGIKCGLVLASGIVLSLIAGCADWSAPAWSTSSASIDRPTSHAAARPTTELSTPSKGVPITIDRSNQRASAMTSSGATPRPELDRASLHTSSPSTTTPNSSVASVSFNNEADGAPAGNQPKARPASASSNPGFKAFGEIGSSRNLQPGELDEGINIAQITDASDGSCFDPAIDRTGSWIVFASTMHRPTADLYLKSVDGRTITQLTADPADDVMPAISPDGQRIAFASNRSDNWDIYTTSLNGGQVTQITTDSDAELHPTWSPDGRYVAYCKLGAQSQRWEIWIVDVNNLAAPRFLEYGLFPKWSPDPARSKLLFQRPRQRGSRFHSIWTVDIVGNEAIHPTEIVSAANAAAINPSWSPDGSHIAFVTVVAPNETVQDSIQQSDVWIVNIDGTGRTNLTNGQHANFQPVWGPDSKVYFVSNRSGTDNIWMVSAAPSSVSQGPSAVVNAQPKGANPTE